MMGGSIRLESELGRGSTFHVEVPFPVEQAAAPAAPSRIERARLLVIEPNATGRDLLGRLAAVWGATAVAVGDVSAARAALENGDRIDVVLLDASIPDDGADAFAAWLGADARWADLGVVVLAAPGLQTPDDVWPAAGSSATSASRSSPGLCCPCSRRRCTTARCPTPRPNDPRRARRRRPAAPRTCCWPRTIP